MELKQPKEIAAILKSFDKIFKKGDISFLTKQAYQFIMLSSGFIAHYNLQGFQSVYSDMESLASEIVKNKYMNQWSNFFPHDKDYTYMTQKRDIYNQIVIMAEHYLIKIEKNETELCANI